MNIGSSMSSPPHNLINFSHPIYSPDYSVPPLKLRGHSPFSSNIYSNIDQKNFKLMELDRRHEFHQNHFRNYINESIRELNEDQIRKSLEKRNHLNNSFAIGDPPKIKKSFNSQTIIPDRGKKINYESIIMPYERKRTVSLFNPNKYIENNNRLDRDIANSPKYLTETKQRVYPLENQYYDAPNSQIKERFEQKIIPYETIFKPKNSNALNFNERRVQFNTEELKKQAINNEPYMSKLHSIKKKTFSSDFNNDCKLYNNPYLSDLKWRRPINNENFFPFQTSNHSNVKKPFNFQNNDGFYNKPSYYNNNNNENDYKVKVSNIINDMNNLSEINNRVLNSNIFNQNENFFGNTNDLNENIFFPGEDQPLFYSNKPQKIEKTIDKSILPLVVQDFLILIDYDREIEKFKSEIKKNKTKLSFFYQIMKKNANSIVDKGDFSALIKYFCPNAHENDIFLLMKRVSKSESLNLKFIFLNIKDYLNF